MKKRLMNSRLAQRIGLLALAVIVLAVPILGGCGGGGVTQKHTIVIGFLEDLTGPAGYSVSQTYGAVQDYFRMVEDEDLIPGVTVKFNTYDTRLDYSRALPGYVWLKSQGADMIFMFVSTMAALVGDKFGQDKLPCFVSQAIPTTLGKDWIFHLYPGQNFEAEAIMKWILDNWNQSQKGRPFKIGLIGQAGYEAHGMAKDVVSQYHDQYPDRFDMVSLITPVTATSFAGELAQLKDCDYIFPTAFYGPGLANFLKEARLRGFQGTFITTINTWFGFRELIEAIVPLQQLDGSIGASTYPYWTDAIPFVAQAKANLEKYRPDEADFQLNRSYWLTGQAYGMVLADVIKRAVEKVGPANVDGNALREALADTSLAVEGWGTSAWAYTQKFSVLQRNFKMLQYRASENSWFSITDWFSLTSLS